MTPLRSARAHDARPLRRLLATSALALATLALTSGCATPVEAERTETTRRTTTTRERRTTTSVRRTTTTSAPTTTVPPTTTTTAPPTTTTAPPPPPPPPTTAAPAPAPPPPAPAPVVQPQAGGGCHPSYEPCVPIASDVDCAGGSGNGPEYTGFVTVVGPDEYDLDRDGDGTGCE